MGNNVIWQTFPLYGKSPPNTNSICNIGTACAIGGGGGENPIDGELLPFGILSGGKEIHGGGGESHVTPASIALQKRLPRTS